MDRVPVTYAQKFKKNLRYAVSGRYHQSIVHALGLAPHRRQRETKTEFGEGAEKEAHALSLVS